MNAVGECTRQGPDGPVGSEGHTGNPTGRAPQFAGHSFHAMWYTVLMLPSVESMVMKLTLPGFAVPAFTLSSVLMLKLR